MKRCCKCRKIVWPWQQSKISMSPIHLSCHRIVIEKSSRANGLYQMFADEISEFETATGIKTKLRV